jgi:hypothetical protein
MDPAQTLGAAVRCRQQPSARAASRCAAALIFALFSAAEVVAQNRYAVVIAGAAGGEAYAAKYDQWRATLVATLRRSFQYDDEHLFVLADTNGEAVRGATRENVRQLFSDLRRRIAKDDLLFVFLIGHGTTADNDEAKFNLVGPDLSSSEWAELVKPIAATVVFADTTPGSFPFVRRLAAARRVVLTATDSPPQQFETIFPEYFVKAFTALAADADKNGRVSIWEAFAYASAAVARWFEQQGRLPTERAVLDDDGDGVGREAQTPGSDGALARSIYLGSEPTAAGVSDLRLRLAELQRQLDDLKVRKASSPEPARFDAEIERLLLEIARLSRESGK